MLKKLLISAVVIVVSVISLTACGNNEIIEDPAVIADKIVSEVYEADTMSKLTDDRLSSYYDIDLSLVESYGIYIEGSGGFANETAVFKAKDEIGVEAVKKSIASRIEQRKKDFESYNPEENVKIENCLLLSKGNYVLFVISDNNDKAEEIFNS